MNTSTPDYSRAAYKRVAADLLTQIEWAQHRGLHAFADCLVEARKHACTQANVAKD